MATIRTLALLLISLSLVSSLRDHEIGERSVLLPIDYGATHRVQHLMEAFGGCYIWSTSEPSLLKISPLDNDHDCKSRVLVEVQRQGSYSGPLTISATDKDTKQVMKAIVKLSKLHRIEILTKFRIMNLFQVQQFYLIGYDELGNSFSSLEGLKFEWAIEQKNRVAETITIRESNIFQETNYRRSLEELGYQTDMLVIKALNIGEIQLTVRLNEPNYEHIYTSIKLSVQERFDIIPVSPIYMLSGSRVRLSLLNAKEEKIKLPASYYDFQINPSFKVTDDLVITSPEFETEGKLVVRDTRTQPPYTNEVDIFNLHPDSVEVSAKSYIIVGDNQPFKVTLFNNRRQLRGSVSLSIDSDFYINRENSSFVASGKGTGYIRASYNGLTHEKRIVANLPLKLVLIGNKIVLPPGQSFQMRVLGGSGSYEYELIDPSDVGDINQNGVIKTHTAGKAKVVVMDSNDNNNKIEVELVVDDVKLIRSFDEKLEAGIGEEVTMLAIAQPEHERQFTQCDELEIGLYDNDLLKFRSDQESTIDTILKIHQNARKNPQLSSVLDIFRQGRDFNLNDYRDYLVHDEIPMQELQRLLFIQDNFGICKALRMEPVLAREGEAAFQIQNRDNYISTPFKVKIYKDLGIKDQTSNRVLLTPGAYFVWRTNENGADGTTYFLNNIKVREGDPISLTCSEPGETKEYNIKVIHQISQKLPRPYTRQIKIIIQCLHPSSLKFKSGDHLLENNQLYTVGNSPFEVQLKGFDHLGREFFNISSLEFNWDLDGVSKNEINPQENIYKFSYTSQQSNPHINVRTSGSRYHGINFPEIEGHLNIVRTKEFELAFKNRQVLHSLTLVATPNNKHIIRVIGGSNNFDVKSSNTDLLKASFYSSDNGKIIELLPLKRGTTKLFVTDLDQYGRPVVEINVKIVNPVRLRIKSNVTLVQEGSGFRLSYFVYGEDDLLIDEAQYQYLNIVPKYNCQLEEIDPKTFRALRRGHCSVSASMVSHSLSSQNSVEIQVFPKFSINIPGITQEQRNGVKYYTGETRIPLGCNSTIMFLGGPFGVGKLSYEASSTYYLDIHQLNLRTFRLIGKKKGTTDIKFVLRDGQNEISVVQVHVIIKDLESVVLPQSNRQIHEKATVRLVPEFLIDGQRVLHSKCPVVYEWKTDNQDVLSIKGWNNDQPLQNTGLNVTAIKKGYGRIELTPIFNSRRLQTQQILIEVLETAEVDLATYIHHGKVRPTSLLIPPNSGYTINSTYTVDIVSPCEDLMKVNGNTIQTFNDKGGSVVQLRSTNGRENNVHYMSVQVERIYSLFIENPLGKINMQLDTEIRIPFYVQDSFGRLFPNNLRGIEFDVRVTDPQTVTAELSADKEEIILRGSRSGQSQLYISVVGQPDIYDVVSIHTMILLEPLSPVEVHVGGNIQFRSLQGVVGEWRSEDPSILQIDRRSGKALALKDGSTQISYNYGVEYKSRVTVIRVSDVELKSVDQYMTNYKVQEHKIQLKALVINEKGTSELKWFQTHSELINNNLIVKCESVYPLWFDVQCAIQGNDQGTQSIFVYPKAVKNYPSRDEMPPEFKIRLKLQSGTTGETIVYKTISHPFSFEFRIPRADQYVSLNAIEKVKSIDIQTNHRLNIVSDHERINWMSTEFIPQKSIQILRIDMRGQPQSSKPVINLFSPITKQKEKIVINYSPSGILSSSPGVFRDLLGRWSLVTWVSMLMLVILVTLGCYAYSRRDFIYYGKDD